MEILQPGYRIGDRVAAARQGRGRRARPVRRPAERGRTAGECGRRRADDSMTHGAVSTAARPDAWPTERSERDLSRDTIEGRACG